MHTFRHLGRRIALLAAFLAVHGLLIWQGFLSAGYPMGDITGTYTFWVQQLNSHIPWYGLAQPWVYPFPDLLFVYGPSLVPGDYTTNWLSMSIAIDTIALLFLVGVTGEPAKDRLRAGWIWTLLLLLIGPVGISRLDNVSVAIAVIALSLWHNGNFRFGAAVGAIAVWIKVWPVAILLGFFTRVKTFKTTLIWAACTGIAVYLVGFLISGPQYLLSFITMQGNRGIQLEAPIASLWLWKNTPASNVVYFDQNVLAYQVSAPGTELVASLMGYAQLVAIGITAGLAFLASRRNRETESQEFSRELAAITTLTATLDLIVFNKVGSPQYYGWLFVPAMMLVLWRVSRLWVPLVGVALLVCVTQVVYPTLYDPIVFGETGATWILIGRNLLVVLLLVYANTRLIQLSKSSLSSGPTLSRSIKNPS